MSLRPESIVADTKTFLDWLSAYIFSTGPVDVNADIYPLQSFSSYLNTLIYLPLNETRIQMSPLCYAAFEGLEIVIPSLACAGLIVDQQDHQVNLDYALFLANYQGHQRTAKLLLCLGANPGRELAFNGLHGAAGSGQIQEIRYYIQDLNVPVDVLDSSFATPVIHAMRLESPRDWETIEWLFHLGANPTIECGELSCTYTEYALAMEKDHLAQKLTAAAVVFAAAR